jgi:hypothetical protein
VTCLCLDETGISDVRGCDELIFVPTTASPDQVTLLAGAVR